MEGGVQVFRCSGVRALGRRDVRPSTLNPRPCRLRRWRGFTLIEILVVIIIIAVMSSVAVPAYFRFMAHAAFVQSVQQTVSLLGWARNAAVETGTQVTVAFDLHAGTITVQVQRPDTTDPSGLAADMPTAMQDEQNTAATLQPRVSPLGEDITVTGLTVIPGAAGSDPTNGGANPMPAGINQAQQAINFYSDGTADNAQFALVSADGFHASIAVVPTTGRTIVGDE